MVARSSEWVERVSSRLFRCLRTSSRKDLVGWHPSMMSLVCIQSFLVVFVMDHFLIEGILVVCGHHV